MKIRTRLFAFLAFVWLSALPMAASAQLIKVTTSYVSDSAAVLPLWLAKEAGIFARNGLDVQAVRVHAAVGMMALMSGELQFVLVSGPVVVESALRGSNAVYVAGGMSTLDFVLVTRPEIKTAEQLKGGTVGLSAFRGADPTATRFALQKLGLGPKDVSLIVVGGTSERIASLRLGKIQGTHSVRRNISQRSAKGSTPWRTSRSSACRSCIPVWRRPAPSSGTNQRSSAATSNLTSKRLPS